jgi:hypothetical protein
VRTAVDLEGDGIDSGLPQPIERGPVIGAGVEHDEVGVRGEQRLDVGAQRLPQAGYCEGGVWKHIPLRSSHEPV